VTPKNLQQLVNKFNKVAVYKTNKQKLVVFLYANNKPPEKEVMKIFPFT
jgi:hypothetical protein